MHPEQTLALRRQVADLLTAESSSLIGVDRVTIHNLDPGQIDTRSGQVVVDSFGLLIGLPNGQQFTVDVSSMQQELGPNPSPEAVRDLTRTLVPHVGGPNPLDLDWEEASALLLPRVIPKTNSSKPGRPWGGLAVSVILDDTRAVMYANGQLLERWGRTEEEVYATAMENLRRRFGNASVTALSPEAVGELKAWALEGADPDINATLVLLPELVAKVPVALDQMFVMIPYRSAALLVKRPETVEERKHLAIWAAELFCNASAHISPYLLVWSDGALVQAFSEDIWGFRLHLSDSEEDGAGGEVLMFDHPETGERVSVFYPVRQTD